MKKLSAGKIVLFVCFSCIISSSGFAQYTKYIVQFKNKNNTPFSLSNPQQYLSQKSIDRRTRYSIAVDSSDLPVNPAYIQQVVAQGAVAYLSQSKWLNQILISTSSAAAVNAIKALPFVKTANPIGQFAGNGSLPHRERFKETVTPITETAKIAAPGTIYDYGNSYSQIHIHNGEFLHQKGLTGTGMTISIIDAGFYRYKTTKAFDSARAHNQFLGERDFVDFDGSVNEDNDHGELCLSTIAANVPGVMVGTAPNANFWLLRGENVNSEFPVEEHNWVAAAEFADSTGSDLISSSLGYFTFDDAQFNHTYNDFYKNTTTVSKGATYAAKKGMIVTNSAGNEGGGSWNYIIFPADDDSVCSVAATTTTGAIASFSSYGYPGKVKPNIASVGSGTTLYASYGLTSGSGTSFSNPNINGLIACLWQGFPQFNNMTILDAVYRSSSKYNAPDNRFGYGIPNMKRAFRYLKSLQNKQQYGAEWLFVKQPNFNDRLDITLIGRVEGNATVNLINVNGKIVASKKISTDEEEIYTIDFSNLENLAAGSYTVQYKDKSTTKSIKIVKEGTVVAANWLKVSPVPFKTNITATLTAQENGKVVISLTDVRGKIWETKEINVIKNQVYTINFPKAVTAPMGVYFIQYKDENQSRSVTVQKQ